jgi:hypothetical protein
MFLPIEIFNYVGLWNVPAPSSSRKVWVLYHCI